MPDESIAASPEEIASGRTLRPEMVGDLRIIAAAETASAEGLTQALKKETGLLTEERIENIAKQFFDDATAESIVRTIQIVQLESKQLVLTLIDGWRKVSDERRQLLPDKDFAALRRNLDALVQNYPGLALMHKARRLLRDTGNEIKESIFICDLRPVFDEPQERVEGFVAIANLRVRYVRQSGEPNVFEIALTEDELSNLIEQGQKAINKLKVLKETVHDLIQ